MFSFNHEGDRSLNESLDCVTATVVYVSCHTVQDGSNEILVSICTKSIGGMSDCATHA